MLAAKTNAPGRQLQVCEGRHEEILIWLLFKTMEANDVWGLMAHARLLKSRSNGEVRKRMDGCGR